MSKKKLFKVSALAAGFLLGTSVISYLKAGTILRNSPTVPVPFSNFPSTASSYKIGLEVYNPGVTVTSPSTTVIALKFNSAEISNGTVNTPFTVSFNFVDGDARFSTIGPNYVWILTNSTNLSSNATVVYAASTAGAIGSMITLTSGNVDNPQPLPSNTNLYLMQAAWTDNNTDGKVARSELSNPPNNPSVVLLNKQANCTTKPVWPLTASISGANGNIVFPTVSFAYVTPQFSVKGPEQDVLNAELDADTDFKTFVGDSNNNIIQPDNKTISVSNFFSITDQQTTEPEKWIVWSSTGVTGNISFNLSSVINEPGVTNVIFKGVNCTESTPDKTWSCNSGSINLDGSFLLELSISGNTPNNPTSWSISNVSIGGNLCYNIPQKDVGIWYGGVEALVPFVKSDPAVGAQTYIVFYNRRDVAVPVYAKALLQDPNRIVISTNQIDTIPPQSRRQYTADQLKNLLPELASYDMRQGVPIKFFFRVPTQREFSDDPYIEGIVVSVYGSEQRSVPLKFKWFKQGHYNE